MPVERNSERRREYLKQYLLACVQDSVLSIGDLTSPAVFDKLLKVLSRDMKAVLVDLGKTGASSLLGIAGMALAGMAQDVIARQSKK